MKMQKIYLLAVVSALLVSCTKEEQKNANYVGKVIKVPPSQRVNDKKYTDIVDTGQRYSYAKFDDGYFKTGLSKLYRNDEKEIVVDVKRALMWQDTSKNNSLQKSWRSAKRFCSRMKFQGFKDWRLPTIRELKTIIDKGKYNSAIKEGFMHYTPYFYWTSSINSNYRSYAWNVSFYKGSTSSFNKSSMYYVRCVRTIKDGDLGKVPKIHKKPVIKKTT